MEDPSHALAITRPKDLPVPVPQFVLIIVPPVEAPGGTVSLHRKRRDKACHSWDIARPVCIPGRITSVDLRESDLARTRSVGHERTLMSTASPAATQSEMQRGASSRR